jgi:eukaryotic-like serine/threonine-protein kinase
VNVPLVRDRSRGSVAPVILASIVTSVLVFVGMRMMEERGLLPFLSGGKASGESVEVPSLLGMLPDQARELLKGRGLLLTLSAERENTSFPAGVVAEQSPLPGSQVSRGSVVQSAIARGSRQVAIPSLVGMRTEDALHQLVAAGFVAAPKKTANSDTAAPGIVVDTQPPPGTLGKPQSPVTLVVSVGPATKPLPKLIGMRFRAAKELLEQQGFKLGKIRYGLDNDRAGGIVLDQKPPVGEAAATATVVELTINED